jgi:hypothetical protein
MSQPVKYIHTSDVHNTRAASEIVPFIIEMFHPHSVTDVGCGLGSWLKIFEDFGIADIIGYDGNYVNRNDLLINPANFISVDIEKPLPAGRKSDLALCLEVAEHLQISSAESLVSSLVSLSEIIIFSAAVPGQGGQNHLNEQWPDWWAQLFEKHGYLFYDVFREKFWDNKNCDWWYRQNLFVVTTAKIAQLHGLHQSQRALIHPDLFNNKLRKINDYESGSISVFTAIGILKKSLIRLTRKSITRHK